MGELINFSSRREQKLTAQPTVEELQSLPVMPLALGDDQPLFETFYTLPDGRSFQLFLSNQYGRYLVQIPDSMINNLKG